MKKVKLFNLAEIFLTFIIKKIITLIILVLLFIKYFIWQILKKRILQNHKIKDRNLRNIIQS